MKKLSYEERCIRDNFYKNSLEKNTPSKNKKEVVFSSFENKYLSYAINNPNVWKSNIRSKNIDRLTLDRVEFTFKKYKTPAFLNKVWYSKYRNVTEIDFRLWYVIIASGLGSLYKYEAHKYLTRKEFHNFVQAPENLSPLEAIWWGRAISNGAILGNAKNIAKNFNRVVRDDLNNESWKRALLFFSKNTMSSNELSQVLDYLHHIFADKPNFSFKNRTVDSLKKLSDDWHKLIAKQKEFSKHNWDGANIPDWKYSTGKDLNLCVWTMKQLKTSKELVAEGHAMRHCVGGYVHRCVSGKTFIWSLSYIYPNDYKTNYESKRAITVELHGSEGHYYVVQERGFANRLPNGNEREILNKWKQELEKY